MNNLANTDQVKQSPATVTPIKQGTDMMAMLFNAALTSELNIEKLERLIELKERHDKLIAEQSFNAAFAAYKLNEPVIVKRGKAEFLNSKGITVSYTFARLADITESVKTALAAQGLSFRWDFADDGGRISVTCWLQHAGGHAVACTASGLPDTSGSKNPMQSVISTKTYLERMTLLSVLGMSAIEPEQEEEEQQAAAAASRVATIVTEMRSEVKTIAELNEFIKKYADLPDREYTELNAAAQEFAAEIRAKRKAAAVNANPSPAGTQEEANGAKAKIQLVPEIETRYRPFSGRLSLLAQSDINKAKDFFRNQKPEVQEAIRPMLDYLVWKSEHENT